MPSLKDALSWIVAAVVWIMLAVLARASVKRRLYHHKGWALTVAGGSAIFFGALFEAALRATGLDPLTHAGKSRYLDILGQMGYVVGAVLVLLGSFRWLALARRLDDAERDLEAEIEKRTMAEEALRHAEVELELSVQRRTSEVGSAYEQLQEETYERQRLEEQFLQSQKMESIGRLAGGLREACGRHRPRLQ